MPPPERRELSHKPQLAQQKEATQRRARGATLQELAHSHNVSNIHHSRRHARRMSGARATTAQDAFRERRREI